MPYVCSMNDKIFMQRALELAANGFGGVSPNPMVGCVIVHDGRVIGEGWHQQFGGPHAEVMAVDRVEDKAILTEATVYVSLEPCSFHGKTPACTDLLIKHNPKKVVIGSLDPNPRVSGSGVEILRQAGIDVEHGVLAKEAIALNKRFFIAMQTGRPYIILKWAQTADGFLARTNYDSKWISNELSRQLVHKWRSEEDGVLTGYNTVVHDNPRLTVRDWQGRNPSRIVLDPKNGLDDSYHVFDQAAKTYWLNTREEFKKDNIIANCLPEDHQLIDGLQFLYKEKLGSIIVEGGAATLKQFIDEGLWDEARIFTATKEFNEGISAPELEIAPDSEQIIEGDRLSTIFNPETAQFWQKN